MGAARPMCASICARRVSMNSRSRAAPTFGTITRSTRWPAASTTSTRSRYANGVSTALMRTMRPRRPKSISWSARTTCSRAAGFSSGTTASSRSRQTASAALRAALAIISGCDPGTNSVERARRPVRLTGQPAAHDVESERSWHSPRQLTAAPAGDTALAPAVRAGRGQSGLLPDLHVAELHRSGAVLQRDRTARERLVLDLHRLRSVENDGQLRAARADLVGVPFAAGIDHRHRLRDVHDAAGAVCGVGPLVEDVHLVAALVGDLLGIGAAHEH